MRLITYLFVVYRRYVNANTEHKQQQMLFWDYIDNLLVIMQPIFCFEVKLFMCEQSRYKCIFSWIPSEIG